MSSPLPGDLLHESVEPAVCACGKPAYYTVSGENGEKLVVCAECLAALRATHDYARRTREAAAEEGGDD